MPNILYKVDRTKVKFDENNKKHVEAYVNFLRTSSWGKTGCPFSLDFPYLTIPDMIKDKLVRKYLKV